jgi:hypothetical protein
MPGAYGTWHGCLPAWGRNSGHNLVKLTDGIASAEKHVIHPSKPGVDGRLSQLLNNRGRFRITYRLIKHNRRHWG